LPLHLAAEITDTCSPSLYISLLLAQIDNINQSFLCALWLCSSHEKHYLDNIDNNAVIINVYLCSYSEQVMSPGYAFLASY
jgi:hypothetical protein